MSDLEERRRQRAERRRKLAEFYDLPAEAERAVVSPLGGEENGVMVSCASTSSLSSMRSSGSDSTGNDIDRPGFEPRLFLRRTLEECSVQDLVVESNKFESEISDLDGEMQNLVYDNYTKFISATDTIRQMKRNVENMEQEMQSLIKSMEVINRKSDKVTHNLGSRRSAVETLSRREAVLMQLKDLFELPRYLKNCIIKKAYKQAVNRFMRAEEVLESLRDQKSFQKIYDDCRKQVALIAEHLKAKLVETTGEADSEECVELLLNLGEPTSFLCASYLDSRRHVVFSQEWKVKAEHNHQESVADLKVKMVSPLISLCETCDRLFWRSGDVEMTEEITQQLREMYMTILHCTQEIVQKKEIPSFSSSKFQVFVGFLLDVARIRAELRNALRSETLKDMVREDFAELMESWMAQCLETSQNSLERKQNIRIQSLVAIQGATLDECEKLCDEFAQDIHTFLAGFQSFSHSPNAYLKELSHKHTRSVFLTLSCLIKPSRFTQEREGVPFIQLNDSTDCFHFLVFCKLALVTAQQTLPSVATFLRQTINFSSESREARLFNVEKLSQELTKLAEDYMMDFLRLGGSSIASLVKKAVETPNWMTMKTPREVRQSFVMIHDEMQRFQSQIAALFPTMLGVPRPSRPPSIVLDFNAIEMDVNRLMSADLRTFRLQLPRMEVSCIVSELIKFQLKTLLELVRLRTFDHCGAQQMQVNCFYLSKVWEKMLDHEHVDSACRLLSRVLRSVAERCLDPGFLDAAIVEGIVAKSLPSV